MKAEENNFDGLLRGILKSTGSTAPPSSDYTRKVMSQVAVLQLDKSKKKSLVKNALRSVFAAVLLITAGALIYSFVISGNLMQAIGYFEALNVFAKMHVFLSGLPMPMFVIAIVYFIVLRAVLVVYFLRKVSHARKSTIIL